MSLRVAIIDDHRVFRDALRALFAARDDIELVGEAGEIDEACELVATARPDVVLMDAMLGPDSGFEIAEALRRTRSPAKILFLSALRDESTIARALASG